MSEHYKFFQNKECEYFPCHNLNEEDFNCLFCYCPLYMLKEDCGGNFEYLGNGIKDCTNCTIPHIKNKGYDFILKKMNQVIEQTKKEID